MTRFWATLFAVSTWVALSACAAADNTIEIVGETGASAMMLFVAVGNKVYVVDKTERNPVEINGHPAWATEYDTTTNKYRAMDVRTNSFCAGGNVLGNGTWLNVGGNQPVTYGGLNGEANAAPYNNGDGGRAIRLLDPCDDESCVWVDRSSNYMTTRRWYPTLETLEDGTIIILGGCLWGGYVNEKGQDNPTYEFFPSRGGPVGLNILANTLPTNLYPLTWLLPSGNLFIQSNWGAAIFDYKKNVEYPLPNIPHSTRTYPASAATAMFPLTPANNWTATVIFCGGTDLQPDQWKTNWNIAAYPVDTSCVSITPDVDGTWKEDDPLPEARNQANLINLPDGRFVLLNGAGKGTAGYGNTSWAIGQSFGDDPVHTIRYFDPTAPAGQRFSDVVASASVDRMYHSTATLLADGSILSAGSNPNADFVTTNDAGIKYPTEYRAERFYPDYYTKPRPDPKNMPTTIGYGGQYFDVTLEGVDDLSVLADTRFTIVRPGFSTHAMNMGQRYVQLNTTFTAHDNGTVIMHVSQLPPNPAVLVPGPALGFVVVKGVPSIGSWLMVGNGQLGNQPTSQTVTLPDSVGVPTKTWNAGQGTNTASSNGKSNGNNTGAAGQIAVSLFAAVFAGLASVVLIC